MRITNGIMMNNSLNNINKNKLLMDKLNTQIASTKKLSRPSDDPIAAIRALRLRSTEAELTQYLEKNIEDAEAWMKTTEGALTNLQDVLTKIDAYYNQGVSEYSTVSDRETIITTLKQFKSQLYKDGDADNAGRTIFTGYRTDSTLTFQHADPTKQYEITQNLTLANVRQINKVVGVNTSSTTDYRETDVTNDKLNIVMLAYNNLDSATNLKITSTTNNILNNASVTVKSYQEMGEEVYNIQNDEIVFVPETGELIIGESYYDNISPDDDFSVTYTKTGFAEGDLRPENYFYCTDLSEGVTYGDVDPDTGKKYVKDQKISYNINFNQSLVINVQGKDVLPPELGRDLDITIAAAEAAVTAHNKVTNIERMINTETAAGNTAEVERLTHMKEAAELEVGYAEDNLTKAFSSGITLYQNHQANVNTQVSDLGARMTRVTLNQERLSSQLLTVKELKSTNEDTDIESTAVEFKEARRIYDAALMMAAQVVQKSLLDFL